MSSEKWTDCLRNDGLILLYASDYITAVPNSGFFSLRIRVLAFKIDAVLFLHLLRYIQNILPGDYHLDMVERLNNFK